MIFNACPKKNDIYKLKNEKTHDFWQTQFATKLSKEKLDVLCIDSIGISELEGSLPSAFQDFIQQVTPDFEETNFNPMNKIMFCKTCCIETNKSLLYDQNISKEHKGIENCFFF